MEPRKFGLHQVYPAQSDTSSRTDIESVYSTYKLCSTKLTVSSIVAIHGLDTHSPKTWVAWKKDGDSASGEIHWLQDLDMLPSIIPNARIFTYDWNASFDRSPATDLLLGHANALLDRLRVRRSKVKFSPSPYQHTTKYGNRRGVLLLLSCSSRLASVAYYLSRFESCPK